MVIAGFGIGPLPVHCVEADVLAGRLWRLPPFESTPRAEIYFVTHPPSLRSRIENELHRAFAEQADKRPPEARVYGQHSPLQR